MTDDGRLELDDDGHVIDVTGPVAAVDLADPGSTDDLAPRRVQRWSERALSPFVARHRRALRLTAAVVVAGLVAAVAWASRPPVRPPTFDLALEDAVLAGHSIGGPSISDDGQLSIAFAVRERTAGERVRVTALRGPGLRATGAVGGEVTDAARRRVELSAQVDCHDPRLAGATPGSYALLAVDASGATSAQGAVPLEASPGEAVTLLSNAVVDWCLAHLPPDALRIVGASATPVPGTTLADLGVRVASSAGIALTVRTDRVEGDDVDVDLSPAADVPAGGTTTLATRVLVHDCSSAPGLAGLGVPGSAAGADGPTRAGLSVQVGIGDRGRLAVLPLPDGGAGLARALAGVCAGAGGVTARVVAVAPARVDAVGGWSLDVLLRLRSDGMGITVGRETFAGGPAGEGSILTSDQAAQGRPGLRVGPVQLDGGAGHLVVPVTGGSCSTVADLAPTTMAVRVLMPDGRVHPYEVPLDDVRLLRSAAAACGVAVDGGDAAARGWRTTGGAP